LGRLKAGRDNLYVCHNPSTETAAVIRHRAINKALFFKTAKPPQPLILKNSYDDSYRFSCCKKNMTGVGSFNVPVFSGRQEKAVCRRNIKSKKKDRGD
jgi:hypothetical protein